MSKKLKILQLCNKPPYPPTDGGTIAMNNVTTGLINAGHSVKVMTIFTHKHMMQDPDPAYVEKTDIEAVFVDTKVNVVDAFSSLITRDSYNISRFFSPDFDMKLANLLRKKKFDIIHVESLFMTPYIHTCRRFSKAKIILRSHNLEYIIWERVAGGTKSIAKRAYMKYLSRKLKDYELSVMESVDGIASISKEDGKRYLKLGIKSEMINLPFGIDINNYQITQPVESELAFFHLGSMDWTPNLEGIFWFLEDVWPKIHKALPTAKLYLAGRRMPDDLMNSNYPNVAVLGEVDDANLFMRSKKIMIVPLLSASGVRVKIIEGMALCKAIVSTRIGAEGIDVSQNKNIVLADEAGDFAHSAIELYKNEDRIEKIGASARRLVEKQFDNEVITDNLIRFYHDLLEK